MNYKSMDIIEEMYQGYCRASDQPRIVTCEFRIEAGEKILDYVDCGYGSCVHTKTCKLMEQMKKTLEQS